MRICIEDRRTTQVARRKFFKDINVLIEISDAASFDVTVNLRSGCSITLCFSV